MQIRQTDMLNLPYANGRVTKGKRSLPDLSFQEYLSPSSSQNNYLKKPLKRYSRELSFKGFSVKNVKVENAQAVLDKVGGILGETFKEKYNLLSQTYSSRIIRNGSSVEFVRKSIPAMVAESLAYPFVKMPFELADFGLGLMKKIPFLKKTADSMYNSKILTSRRAATLKDEEFNAVMGMFDQFSTKMKLHKDGKISDKDFNEWAMNTFHKYFNPKTGKYNSVHERSLNRIVSGIIPAFFLANDAYNLSRFCDDNPKMADKEHDTRFKQELSRVGITAYIQLVILGGLTKFVNSSLAGTALASTLPVLIAETSSRLANGKSITFISKEKARQMAQEQGVISITPENEQNKNDLIYKYYPMPVAFSGSKSAFNVFNGGQNTQFKAFVPENIVEQTIGIVGQATKKRDEENGTEKRTKGLITLSGIIKASVASLALGYAFKFARKNQKIDGALNQFFGHFKDYYNKVVKTDFMISKSEFDGVVAKLKESGFSEIANTYEAMMKTHDADLKKLSKLMQEMLTRLDTPEYYAMLNANSSFLKKHNINPNTLYKNIRGFSQKLQNLPEDKYRLGKVDKKFKPAVDFVIAPFRFMWGAVKLPYTIVDKIIGAFTKSDKPKSISTLESFTNGVRDLQENAKKLSSEDFAKYLKNAMCVSFNNTTKSDYSNADLGKITKLFASTVTTWFLVADDYNMVMMKSLGVDNDGAELKAKERLQQRITGIFYQTLFIDLFNSTFNKIYHTSLLGMSAVTGACSVVCEVFTRKSIGKPVVKMSRDEINDLEYRNIHAPGLKGKYFKFMTDLTGKKAVSADASKKLAQKEEQKQKVVA